MTKLWNQTNNQQFQPWSPSSRAEPSGWHLRNGLHVEDTLIPSGGILSAQGLAPVAPCAIGTSSFSTHTTVWELGEHCPRNRGA